MDGYILDTSVLSAHLDPSHHWHSDVRAAIEALDQDSAQFVSAMSLAELTFGVRMAEAFGGASLPALQQMLIEARAYAVLDVTHHTSAAYAELKTNLAKRYLAKASRRDRPRWLEEWVDKTSGQKLQVDENDVWMCAQGKERDLILVTADGRMRRIADADPEIRLLIL
ncbi:MAG: PIN domain-containing protein [Pseudomonadota bacterium]